jgi:hypothetical protein
MVILGLLNVVIFLFSGIQVSGNEKLPPEFTAMRSALCDKPADFTETGCRVCPRFMGSSEGALSRNGGLGILQRFVGEFYLRWQKRGSLIRFWFLL